MTRVRGMHGERLESAIARVEAVVLRVLRGVAGRLGRLVGGSPSPAALSDDDFQVIRRDWVDAVTVEIVPALGEAFVESATVLAKDFADAGRPVEVLTLEAPSAADFLDAATNRLVAVADTLWEVARSELADGVRAGEGVEELAARLQDADGFGEARARTIARTEVVASANAASLAQALRLGDPSMRKEWLATMDAGGVACDERTRDAHCAAHEQVQPLGEPFEVGDTFLMYPGQPIGPADTVINCRCAPGYLLEDEVVDELLTAAAEVLTGAMVALRPTVEDAKRLAVDGGEPTGQLHATLAYLGTAADIPGEAQARIIDAVFDLAEGMPPLTVEGFAVSVFNPGDANDRDPCIVLGLSGEGLDDVQGHVAEALLNLQSEPAGFTLPEQHTPWQPHVTLVYTDDVSMVEQLADRVGPVTFDAIRVAFAGEVFDIPLGVPEGGEGDGGGEDDDFDWDAYVATTIQARFQSRMPAQLQRFWIRRLSLGTPGSFRRCVRELRRYFPDDTEGLCANLYHEATGRWPGRKKGNAAVSDTDGEGTDAFAAAEIPDDGLITAETDGEPATVDSTAVLPGEHFHTRVLEGVSTGMRQFAAGAITWRTPPFAYHWQWKSSAHNGLPETIQVGLVTRALRDDPNVHFWGRLDLRSPEGLDYARRLVEGWARWSSVGGDESIKDKYIDVEYVLADEPDPGTPLEDPEIDLMTFNQYRVAEISGVSVPALADATVEPTQELIDTLVAMGVVEPAQVAGGPPPGEEIQEDEVAEFAAVRSHDTPTTEGTWDAGANEKRLPSPLPVSTAREEYAWVDDSRIDGDHIPQDACSLPHHEVSADGAVGAANVGGVRNALARLSQTDIPEADREAVHAHLAAHLSDAGGEPADLGDHPPAVVVAAGHTITLPDAPPAAWFGEPADDELPPYGSVRVDANGRLIGLLAPAQVNHRSFPGKRVKVPMGNVDYSGWQNKPWQVDDGSTVNVGVITMDCGHASTNPGDWSYSNRREHYDNTCSIAAHARAYEKPGIGVALAGAIAPWLDAEGFQKLLSADLSGDWPPHPDRPGWRDFIAALAVPVGGFANRARLRVAEGALVAAAVPVQFDDMETPMEMEQTPPMIAEGTRVRVIDPRDPEVTEGEIAVMHPGPTYALMVPGRDEPVRWYVAEELEPADAEPVAVTPVEVEELVASAGPDLRPALERIAKGVGLDAKTRMEVLRSRVHSRN